MMTVILQHKKLDLRGERPPRRHCIKKKTFSHRSRKPPNPCPTCTQWPVALWVRPGPVVLWIWGQTRWFFCENGESNSRRQGMPAAVLTAALRARSQWSCNMNPCSVQIEQPLNTKYDWPTDIWCTKPTLSLYSKFNHPAIHASMFHPPSPGSKQETPPGYSTPVRAISGNQTSPDPRTAVITKYATLLST